MTKTEFRPFPDVPAEFNDDVARYLAYYWQGLDSAVVAEFLDVGGPWSMVLWGRPGTGKSMLAAAFSVLAGSAVQDYPQRRGMLTLGDATCRLRLSDEIVSGAFLLHGQTAVHVYSVPFDGHPRGHRTLGDRGGRLARRPGAPPRVVGPMTPPDEDGPVAPYVSEVIYALTLALALWCAWTAGLVLLWAVGIALGAWS